jgi:hypothetical protein
LSRNQRPCAEVDAGILKHIENLGTHSMGCAQASQAHSMDAVGTEAAAPLLQIASHTSAKRSLANSTNTTNNNATGAAKSNKHLPYIELPPHHSHLGAHHGGSKIVDFTSIWWRPHSVPWAWCEQRHIVPSRNIIW